MEISCVYTDVINILLIYNARFFGVAINKLVKLPSPEAMVEARSKSGAAPARGQGGGCGGVGADPASTEIGEGGAVWIWPTHGAGEEAAPRVRVGRGTERLGTFRLRRGSGA